MKITNKHNLPQAIVEAIKNDPYEGKGDITATRLIGPTMIRYLEKKHYDEIEEDASNRIWALVGQAIHGVIERASTPAELTEKRLGAVVNGFKLSGQFDLLANNVLTDFKVTSVWSVKEGHKEEWENQLNVLAFLLRKNSYQVDSLQVVAILRDWRKNESLRYDNYPQQQVVLLPAPMWTPQAAETYVNYRMQLHFANQPVPCTPTERWDKATIYAVMKEKRKSAVRLFESESAANTFIEEQKDKDKLSVTVRPGESVRCKQYCSVAKFCDYGKGVLSESNLL